MISATWWTNSAIYIPEHSQYWFQHAALNLITKSSEFTLLQYSTTLSSIIASFCIIFDICYMMNQQCYIYSRILPVLISACRNKFSHYKTWIYTITVFCNTLKLNHIILYNIWYQHAVINLVTTRREFTLFQYSTTLSSINISFCIIFDICYMMNQQYYIYFRILQVLFQHAALNLITTKWEFTLLQYSTTLSSIIASFCIIFDICYMMNQQYYIYSRILPVLISACRNQFNHYKTWIYSISVFYNTLKHNHIILYHIWHLLHDEPTVLYIFQNTPSINFNMLHWI